MTMIRLNRVSGRRSYRFSPKNLILGQIEELENSKHVPVLKLSSIVKSHIVFENIFGLGRNLMLEVRFHDMI